RPASARLSASMIWLSVKRDFFIVEILLWRHLLLKTLVLRGDYQTEFNHDAKSGQIGDLRALSDSPARSPNARDESFFTIARAPFYRSMTAGVASENLK
ncbi:hypothetical protein J1777_13790, partial [Comamonas denitrificans]